MTKTTETIALAATPGDTIPCRFLGTDGTIIRYEIPADRVEELEREFIAAGARPLKGEKAKAARARFAAIRAIC